MVQPTLEHTGLKFIGPLTHEYFSILNTTETNLRLAESTDSGRWMQSHITWKANYGLDFASTWRADAPNLCNCSRSMGDLHVASRTLHLVLLSQSPY